MALPIGAILTILSSFYNSSSNTIGLGNDYYWYGLPLGYSVFHTNELMGTQLFHYFSYVNGLLDFTFWALIVFFIVFGVQHFRKASGKKEERLLVSKN
jgi:large-conductance mechanosensitive channel